MTSRTRAACGCVGFEIDDKVERPPGVASQPRDLILELGRTQRDGSEAEGSYRVGR
jgi:hypothetical protein